MKTRLSAKLAVVALTAARVASSQFVPGEHWKSVMNGMKELMKEATSQVSYELKHHGELLHPKVLPKQESNDHVVIATFDQATGPTYSWRAMNDPVMGGQSHSDFEVQGAEGRFKGTCAVVPFLKAPGFCKVSTERSIFRAPHFADASAFIGGALYLDVVTTTPGYKGFFVAFDAKNAVRPPGAMHHAAPSFKASFQVPGTTRTTVKVPFDQFSVDWSDFTGRCDTKDPNNGFQHHCCSKDHPEVCPEAKHLAQITGLEIWAEGVAGDFDLGIFSIGAGPLGGNVSTLV